MTTDPIDFYGLELLLDDSDRELLHAVREFGDKQVTPIINDYWTRAAFPFELVPALRDLRIAGTPYTGYGCPGRSYLLDGLIAMELGTARPVDRHLLSASTAGCRWARSTCADPRSRRSAGCRRWLAWRRSARSA